MATTLVKKFGPGHSIQVGTAEGASFSAARADDFVDLSATYHASRNCDAWPALCKMAKNLLGCEHVYYIRSMLDRDGFYHFSAHRALSVHELLYDAAVKNGNDVWLYVKDNTTGTFGVVKYHENRYGIKCDEPDPVLSDPE